MTAEAARPLGLDIFVLEREAGSPAAQIVGSEREIVGDWRDASARAALASQVELITLENEFVDAAALQWLVERGTLVYPGPDCLSVIQDKLRQKAALARAGLPVPQFLAVGSPRAALEAGDRLGWPFVLKARHLGYDGHGNATVASPAEIAAAIAQLAGGAAPLNEAAPLDLYAEEYVPFRGELAIMVARRRSGAVATYPVVETVQRDHICHEVVAPARLPGAVARQAEAIAVAAVDAVAAVGVVGVELFWLADDRILVNELAPRPHNSGHYTIEACHTSQFANHLRAVLDWPLGATDLVAPAAAMVNLLGTRGGPAKPDGLAGAKAVAQAYVHLYGKREVRPGRKMGHVTALGATPEDALARAREAARRITW